MKSTDVVKEFVKTLASGELEKAATYLAVDFTLTGLTPQPIGREEFLEMERGLLTAFKDWRDNLIDLHEEAGSVIGIAYITGTHSGELVLPVSDLPVVPATGKHISLPGEVRIYRVRGTKIASLEVVVTPRGGFQGLYRQLGVRLPAPSAISG